MTTSIASDGLAAREIKSHSFEKIERHRRYCGIFNGGMKDAYQDNRGYLELFAGPGLCIDTDAAEEVDGCPLVAAASAFNKLAFIEYDTKLASALEQRLRTRGLGPERAQVFAADANDPDVLGQALDYLPHPGLIYAFIDPEDLNGDWRAIEQLIAARQPPRFQRIDVLLNFPVGAMKRNYTNDRKITKVLGTDEWVVRVNAGEPLGRVFRETLASQFKKNNFGVAEHTEVRAIGTNTPVYDLVFASGDPKGLEFWKEILSIRPNGQRQLF